MVDSSLVVSRHYHGSMAKEKVTLTLDTEQLAELRSLVDARSLSATVDEAIAARLARVRHAQAVGEWLDELADEHGPIPQDAKDWAAGVFDDWQVSPAKAG